MSLRAQSPRVSADIARRRLEGLDHIIRVPGNRQSSVFKRFLALSATEPRAFIALGGREVAA